MREKIKRLKSIKRQKKNFKNKKHYNMAREELKENDCTRKRDNA